MLRIFKGKTPKPTNTKLDEGEGPQGPPDMGAATKAIAAQMAAPEHGLKAFVAKRTIDRSYWYQGQLITYYAESTQTGGSFCCFEGTCPKGFGPPPHIHLYEHECFYVMDGEMKAVVGAEEFHVETDSFIFLPAGIVHYFAPITATARIFTFTVPLKGHEQDYTADMKLFRELGEPAKSMDLPPPPSGLPTPEQIERALQIGKEAGIVFPGMEEDGWKRENKPNE